MSDDDEVVRLRRQLERERAARKEAETIAERSTRELYDTIERLKTLNASLATPALVVRPRLLLAPLIGVVDRERVLHFNRRMLDACHEHRARTIVVDATAVPAIDRDATATLLDGFSALRLLGVRVIVSGIAADVATELVERELPGRFEVAGDLVAGLELADRSAQ